MHYTNLKVGPARFTRGGTIAISFYQNDELALAIIAEDGEREAVATVALADSPFYAAPEQVWLKGWSENEGIPEALEKAGLVSIRKDVEANLGFVSAKLADVLPPLRAEINLAIAKAD